MTGVQPDLAARVAATRERLELDAETWNPTKHPEQPREIAGLVLERRPLAGAGFNGEDVDQIVLQEPSEQLWKFRLYGTVLQNQLSAVVPDDVVAIRYMGRNPGGQGPSGYEEYKVTVDQGRGPRPAARAQVPPASAELRPPREVEAPATSTLPCDACGMLNGHHAKNCPLGDDDIPF